MERMDTEVRIDDTNKAETTRPVNPADTSEASNSLPQRNTVNSVDSAEWPAGLPECYAIVPAAGKGTRMGASVRKQFLTLDGVPILIRTLMAFERSPIIHGILVAAGSDEIALVEELCARFRITKLLGVVAGGPTRFLSVTQAMDALEHLLAEQASNVKMKRDAHAAAPGEPIVLIHDGARPFVQEDVIQACAHAAVRHGASICGVPVKDTIKVVGKDGRIESTIPREGLWAVQTPQTFRLHQIANLHRRAAMLGMDFTDDAQVAEYFGQDVHMVQGDYNNIKLTTRDDLIVGEAILKSISTDSHLRQ
jgi:2-C-methyl-D-erythritol 4-phosphate cytidylyltransferase